MSLRKRDDNSLLRRFLSGVGRLALRPGTKLRRLDQDVREDISGAGHSLAYLRHLLRGNSIARKAFFDGAFLANVDDSRPPVLLLHGYLGTRGSMYILERRLAEDGHTVFSFNLGALNVRDIRTSAFLIHRKVEAILAQTSVKKIDIVGHSMGGLIGLYYVKKLGGHEKVRKLIMMGTPQKGTWVAWLGVAVAGLVSESAWQLLPDSRFLRELHRGPLPESTDYYTIAAERDWVCPPESTPLDGAHPIVVPFGHSSLVISDEVYRHVKLILSRDRAR